MGMNVQYILKRPYNFQVPRVVAPTQSETALLGHDQTHFDMFVPSPLTRQVSLRTLSTLAMHFNYRLIARSGSPESWDQRSRWTWFTWYIHGSTLRVSREIAVSGCTRIWYVSRIH